MTITLNTFGNIKIKQGTFNPSEISSYIPHNMKVAVISDENVAPLYAKPLAETLSNTTLFTIPAGEEYKTRETKAWLEDQLLMKGFGRDSVIIAIGGGVVTDIAGYLASTWCRGISLISIPTSLLAMVDASIGGKTGINLNQAKNFIGTIYHPKAILIDPTALKTQPENDYRDGLVEMIKHGMIWDIKIFNWIETNSDKLLEKNMTALEKAISDSCQVKQHIVAQDEKEHGIRRILNFGHTIGHALESSLNYEISHGTAVAIGTVVEGYLSNLSKSNLMRLINFYKNCLIPLGNLLKVSDDALLNAMKHDKKSKNGRARFVTLSQLGNVNTHNGEYCTTFETVDIQKALNLCRTFLSTM